MADQPNELDELFLDRGGSVDKSEVARILRPYLRFYGDTKEIITNDAWEDLNLQQKIATYMLGRLALRLQGIIDEDEEKVSPADIQRETKLNGNSIRPSIAKLLENRVIRVDKATGKYYVPEFAVPKIGQLLSKEN